MPCWFFDKKELANTPSYRDGIDGETESRYRREGARFIINCGTHLGLRYNTMASGVVYFHRFYMFHSFKDFPRYVTAACCLFLAGKVEETPKKCKDIIKTARSLLSDNQFAQFGDDQKEEVMTLERILLQTIKFDLQVDHPYAYLLKYAKGFKTDKQKLQKMVQMAWTFVNDSLCTTLCLQWEPELIAIALMYLASRLCKLEIADWQGKDPAFKGKWWDQYVENLSMDLLEDICHEVLDLYSSAKQADEAAQQSPPRTPQALKRRPNTLPPHLTPGKITKAAEQPAPVSTQPAKVKPRLGCTTEPAQSATSQKQKQIPVVSSVTKGQPISTVTSSNIPSKTAKKAAPKEPPSQAHPAAIETFNPYNISQSSMSSYMFSGGAAYSQGPEAIQTVLSGAVAASAPHQVYPPPQPHVTPAGAQPVAATVGYAYGQPSVQYSTPPNYPPPSTGQYYDYSQYQYPSPAANYPPPGYGTAPSYPSNSGGSQSAPVRHHRDRQSYTKTLT